MRVLGGELVARYRPEVETWRRRDRREKGLKAPRLSPSAHVLLAVLAAWRGLHEGPAGCGVQVSIRALAAVLGVSRRMASYALAQLVKQGLIKRRPRQVVCRWFDGVTWWAHADVHSVCYVTARGLKRLEARQGKRIRLVVGARGDRRVLTVFGLVGDLVQASIEKMRFVARRLSALKKRFRPTARHPEAKEKQTSAPQGGRALVRKTIDRPPTPSRSGTDPPGAGTGTDELERLRKLWERGALSPDLAWPEAWAAVLDPKTKKPAEVYLYLDANGQQQRGGRKPGHWFLINQCQDLARRFQLEHQAEARRALGVRTTLPR